MRVASIHTWKVRPGRYSDFMGTLSEGQKIFEKLGGSFRTWVPLAGGGEPTQVSVVIEHDDIEAYGAFTKKLQGNSEYLALMARLQGDRDPAADYVSNALISEPLQQ